MDRQEELLECIRDLLQDTLKELREIKQSQGVCPHGVTGVCMYCMRDIHRDAVQDAMRRG